MCVCMCMCVFVCVCRWRFMLWQPVCVCARACEGESDTRSIPDNTTRGWQRDRLGAHVWRLDWYVCAVCVCVPQDTPMLEPVIEPLEEECVSLLCIHHLSLLRSHLPSCRTLLSHCILFTLGSSSVTTPTQYCPTWPCGCFCLAFTTMSGNLASPAFCEPTVSCLVVMVVVYPTRTQCWKSNYMAKVLHNTMFSVPQRASGLCQVSHTHTSAQKLNHSFWCEAVVCYSSP